MYSFYDYAYNGYLYLNNIMRPHHKKLSQLLRRLAPTAFRLWEASGPTPLNKTIRFFITSIGPAFQKAGARS